jgi:hypothetical protein
LETGSRFLLRLAWTTILFMLPTIVLGMTGAHHHAQLFLLRWGLANCPGRSGTASLPISASHVAWDGRCMCATTPRYWLRWGLSAGKIPILMLDMVVLSAILEAKQEAHLSQWVLRPAYAT